MKRLRKAGSVAVIVVLTLGSASLRAQTPRELLDEAVRLHNEAQIEAAVAKYEEFLARYPDQPAVRSNLGAAYVKLGRYGEAVEQYTKALALDQANTDIRFNLALARYKMGDIDRARVELEKVVKEQTRNKIAMLLLSDCYLQAGEYKKVIGLLSPFEADTDDMALAYLLGTALIRDNQTERGQKLVDRILKNGDSAQARLMLGTAHLLVRDYPGAVKEFEQAVKLDPKLPGAHSFYAKALGEMGESDRSSEQYRLELEVNPYDFDANVFRGVDYYKEEQNYEAAIACFERALRIRPDADEVRFQITVVYLAQGKTQEAQKLLEEIARTSPDFLEVHVALANIYFRQQRKEDAERHRTIANRLRAERQARIEVPGSDPAQQPPAKPALEGDPK